MIFIGLSIPFLVHLYLGFDQFFHGKSLGELGLKKIVSGLFYESNSYVFLISVVFAGIVPALFFVIGKRLNDLSYGYYFCFWL